MATFVRLGSPQSIRAELEALPQVPGGLSASAQAAGVEYLKNVPPFPLGSILAFQLTEVEHCTTISCFPVPLSLPLPSPIGPGPVVVG